MKWVDTSRERAHRTSPSLCVCGWSGLSPPESLETFPRWPSVRPRATSFNTHNPPIHISPYIYMLFISMLSAVSPQKKKKNLKKGWGSLPPPKKRIRSLSISCPGWQAPFLFSGHLPSSSARAHIYTHTSHALPFFFFFFFSLVEMDADGRAFLYFGYKEMDRETPPRHLV